jgi:hypothetical protein
MSLVCKRLEVGAKCGRRGPQSKTSAMIPCQRRFGMWISRLGLITVDARLPRIGTLAQCASITCCALLSFPTNARSLGVPGRPEILQESPNGTDILAACDSDKQSSMNLLTRLAREQVLADHEFLGKTRFSIDQETRTLSFDLNPVPANAVLSNRDPCARPLETLIRVESLRRDFRATIPNETFWPAPLEAIEQVIQRCLQDIERSRLKRGAANDQQECFISIDEQFDKLGALIGTYATAHGLKLAESLRVRDPVIGYEVHVKIDPPGAHVRVMTLLEYKKYQYSKTPKEQYRWRDLLDTEDAMIGWYHYRAEWPPELNGPEEGDFEIKRPGTITFTPTQK